MKTILATCQRVTFTFSVSKSLLLLFIFTSIYIQIYISIQREREKQMCIYTHTYIYIYKRNRTLASSCPKMYPVYFPIHFCAQLNMQQKRQIIYHLHLLFFHNFTQYKLLSYRGFNSELLSLQARLSLGGGGDIQEIVVRLTQTTYLMFEYKETKGGRIHILSATRAHRCAGLFSRTLPPLLLFYFIFFKDFGQIV